MHNVLRRFELAASRAAHAAGISPEVVHAEPGAMVFRYVEGRTLAPEDVRSRDDARRASCRSCALRITAIPQHFRGPAPIFWVFQVLRDYAARLAERRAPPGGRAAALHGGRRAPGAAWSGRSRSCSATTTCSAANLIDDGSAAVAGRLGVCRLQQPAVRPRRPRLEQRAAARRSRSACSEPISRRRRRDDLRRRYQAMKCASLLREAMWSMVSEIHLHDRFRLRGLHRREPRPLRAGRIGTTPGALSDQAALSDRIAHPRPRVVIGGGIVGCSVAYHLARAGWRDVVLLERDKLTSGSTWHAAGLVGQLRSNANITQLLKNSVELYERLEAETGQATGWKRNGGLRLACNAERMIEIRRQATTARSFGLEMHLLSPAEAKELWPLMDASDLVGAAFLPTDGQANPSDITQALARGARQQRRAHRRGLRRSPAFASSSGWVTGVRTATRRDRLRGRGAVRRAMVQGDRQARRRARAAAARAASVPDHRADRRRDRRPADPARSGPPDLLQGGGRRPGDGRLRAGPEALGRARHPGRLRLHPARSRLGPFRAADGAGAGPRAGARDRGRQAADQRPGIVHAGWQLHPRRGAGGAGLLRRLRLQRVRHRLGGRRRPGARRVDRRRRAADGPVAGRHPPLRPAARATTAGSARARSSSTASTTRSPGRPRSTARAGRCAARRSMRALPERRCRVRREARLGARQLVRPARPGRAARRLQLRPAELVRCGRRGAPRLPRAGRAVRRQLVRQVPAGRPRCRGGAVLDLRQRRQPPARPRGLHPDAERRRRHRVRSHRDAPRPGRLLHRHRHRLRDPRLRLDRAPPARAARMRACST